MSQPKYRAGGQRNMRQPIKEESQPLFHLSPYPAIITAIVGKPKLFPFRVKFHTLSKFAIYLYIEEECMLSFGLNGQCPWCFWDCWWSGWTKWSCQVRQAEFLLARPQGRPIIRCPGEVGSLRHMIIVMSAVWAASFCINALFFVT